MMRKESEVTYTFDEAVVSDLYKDANGCRPSAVWLRAFKSMSDRDKQDEWEYLCKLLDEREQEREILEDRAYKDWSQRIETLKGERNLSEAEAIRKDMEALDCDGDVGFYCFRRGLSYDLEYEIDNLLKGK